MKITSTVAAVAVAATILAPTAKADDSAWPANYNIGCSFDRWGFLGSQVRQVCDGPRRADGSWRRGRYIYVPEHRVPAKSTCSGTYSVTCTFYEAHDVEEKVIEPMNFYEVTDDTIPPGEPGWLPEGADVGNA
ncbi:hypothetical protein SEA_TROOPER_37 [Mycobacterium phage Trooper]|nr:hypothetical protein SEA_TROOPER_37 [Mycobacterium phage Trooper]